MKNNKGITLIALVITIIVLLILAGVSIAMLTGGNGVLTKATEAQVQNARGEAVDRINTALNGVYAELLADEYAKDSGGRDISKEANGDFIKTDNGLDQAAAIKYGTYDTDFNYSASGDEAVAEITWKPNPDYGDQISGYIYKNNNTGKSGKVGYRVEAATIVGTPATATPGV